MYGNAVSINHEETLEQRGIYQLVLCSVGTTPDDHLGYMFSVRLNRDNSVVENGVVEDHRHDALTKGKQALNERYEELERWMAERRKAESQPR